MGNNQVTSVNEDVVPTQTLAAAFALSLAMGLVVVTGVVFKPYEAKKVVVDLHERILYEKEMLELRRLSYQGNTNIVNPKLISETADGQQYPETSYSFPPVSLPPVGANKTERAEAFERDVRSDNYWASLQSSVQNHSQPSATKPVVIPPIIIGSAD